MTDYSRAYNGAAKDAANSTILGADFDAEFDSIATASTTKANKAVPASANNIASLSATGDLQDGQTHIIDLVHPIGSVYVSTVSTNPNTLFGTGTWVATGVGRVLVGVGTSDEAYALDDTGGASTETAHLHADGTLSTAAHSSGFNTLKGDGVSGTLISANTHTHDVTGSTANNSPSTGDNMPPYLTVHMWERTA